MLAGTTKPAAPPLNRAQAFLEAQDDVATRRFVVRKNPCLLHMVMLLRQQHVVISVSTTTCPTWSKKLPVETLTICILRCLFLHFQTVCKQCSIMGHFCPTSLHSAFQACTCLHRLHVKLGDQLCALLLCCTCRKLGGMVCRSSGCLPLAASSLALSCNQDQVCRVSSGICIFHKDC